MCFKYFNWWWHVKYNLIMNMVDWASYFSQSIFEYIVGRNHPIHTYACTFIRDLCIQFLTWPVPDFTQHFLHSCHGLIYFCLSGKLEGGHFKYTWHKPKGKMKLLNENKFFEKLSFACVSLPQYAKQCTVTYSTRIYILCSLQFRPSTLSDHLTDYFCS